MSFWIPALNEGGGGNVFVAAAWFLALAAVLAVAWSAVWRRRVVAAARVVPA